ncbi:hypothetical protein FCIRC_433 [Fusarium circinatum]|uniref:DUF6546 domain-containing protein n=1 Tax=Fusarium circinatum TaxID=48490 RepID=A0A8H5XD60_FUSCI|nr:hypothetical protein FCIRC_433 [Fusarium circinatum]
MPPRFQSLPPEIQDMILQYVSLEPSTAPYAVVCKSWQVFFERKNFRSLAIAKEDLSGLRRYLVPRRQGFVKHIWYRICLPNSNPRNRTTIKRVEKPKVTFRADRVFTWSLLGLWDIISLWDSENRITLELSVFAYDDWSSKMRQDRIFEGDFDAYKAHKKSESRGPYHYDNPHAPYVRHYNILGLPNAGWRIRADWNAEQRDLIGWKDIELTTANRASERPYFKEEDAILPRVPIVSKFLIRNTQFRRISPETMSLMFKSFVNLEDITTHRWASVDADQETDWTRYAAKAFAEYLPASVKTLSINGQKSTAFHDWTSRDVNLRDVLGKRLRQYSKNLEHMSVVDIIDATDFLRIFILFKYDGDLNSLTIWPHLKTLTLSTNLFQSHCRRSIERLLCCAARAARKMPKLQTFEIRSNSDPQCLFRYNIVEARAEITWSGPVVNSTKIMKQWEKTAAWRDTVGVVNDF